VPGIVRFDCYEVDLGAHRVSRRGTTVRIRDQSLTVLVALLERPGQVVTREDLRRRLWPDGVFVDFDNALNTAVARLREALNDSADAPRFIETLPKHGYRFIAPLHEAPAPLDRVPRRPRLMVLPFANTSGDPAQDYFASAMTDEIITALAAFAPDELAVVARTTAFHYKGTRKAIAAIASELNLDYVVEGSARRGSEAATLNVQLIRVSDQTHVWAARHDVRLDDLFGAQKAMAETMGAAIGIAPCAGTRPAPRKPTENLEAYTLYRQGRHQLLVQTPENFAAAKQCFEQAVARDPQFALAYDALADLWWYYDFMGFAPPRTVAGIGMSYALRALDIDNTLAETHALLGHYRWLLDYDWLTVRRHLDRALELNPASPLVRVRYAMGPLLTECRLEEAIDALEAALESDPLSTFVRAWLAIMCYLDRQYERSVEESRRIVELEPANYVGYWLVGAYTRECGLFDESIAAHRRSIELSGGSMLMLGWFGLSLGQAGRTAEARAVLEQLRAAADRQAYVPPTCFAWTYLGLRDIDNAFLWLDRAVDVSDRMMVPIQLYPFFDPLRGDPRYAALLRKMKLSPTTRVRRTHGGQLAGLEEAAR
jgi:TolB-like protein/tetratricopeptide (TPR) repeat protein